MTFTHIKNHHHSFTELREIKYNGMRLYVTPCGILPSMTTTLSIIPQPGIVNWQNNIGLDVAKYIVRQGALRGTRTHKIIQAYLMNEDLSQFQTHVLPYGLFEICKNVIDKIDNICALETSLYSSSLGVAGRVDTIAEFEGVLSTIDFKTSTKPKKEEWAENYFLQETGYSLMWQERTSVKIDQIVTIIACENGEVQTFVKNRQSYIPKVKSCIADFYKQYRSELNQVWRFAN